MPMMPSLAMALLSGSASPVSSSIGCGRSITVTFTETVSVSRNRGEIVALEVALAATFGEIAALQAAAPRRAAMLRAP